MAAPRDTSTAAWARQVAAFRAMTPQERVRLAASMVIDPSPPALDSLVESLSTDGWVSSIGLEGVWSRVDQEPP